MSRIDRLLRWSPLQPAANWINRSQLALLAFHGVDDPNCFEQLMNQIVSSSNPISIDELDKAVNQRKELPDRSVLITFDDGHRSVLEHGLPILQERGLPAVAFVVAGLLSTRRNFWWSSVADLVSGGGRLHGYERLSASDLIRHLKQIPNDERLSAIEELEKSADRPPTEHLQLRKEELETLRRGGIAIGNHTWSHPCLNRCDQETASEEIDRAHTALQDVLGEPPRWFAYPNGDWDRYAESVLVEREYRLAFLFDHRLAKLSTNPLRLSRVRVNSDTPPDRFSIILSGLHPAIHHARGRH